MQTKPMEIAMAEKRRIPPFRYYFPEASRRWIVERVAELLEREEFLTTGKYCEELEKRYARYIGTADAVAVSNGTSALEAILSGIGVSGFDVVLPTNTFAATFYAVVRAGGRPVLADCGSDLNLDADDLKRRITKKTKAVVTVHIGGMVSASFPEVAEITEDAGAILVEDAAQAHGTMLDGRKAGSLGYAAGFSFFSTKLVTTGEGGMVTTSDTELVDRIRILKDQGKTKGNAIGAVGSNWRMSELQAILGLAQLEVLEENIAKRTDVAQIYDEYFAHAPLLELVPIPPNVRHNYYKYLALLPPGRSPEVLAEQLRSWGVKLGGYVYEIPLHAQTPLRGYWNPHNSYPHADDLCSRHISLPLYAQMTSDDATYVAKSVERSMLELGWT